MARARQKTTTIVADLSRIKISEHTLEKFCERYKEEFGSAPISPEIEIRRILRRVEEMERRMGFISRILYSGRSKYWHAEGWYLITDLRATTLITAYRRSWGAPRWKPKRAPIKH